MIIAYAKIYSNKDDREKGCKMNYETRIKQLNTQLGDTEARFKRVTEKARKQAMFEAGKMVLGCFESGDADWRGIKREELEKFFKWSKNVDLFKTRFYTDDFEAGEPNKRLKEYLNK